MKQGIILVSCFREESNEFKKAYNIVSHVKTITNMDCKIIFVDDIIKKKQMEDIKIRYKEIARVLRGEIELFEEGLIVFDNSALGKRLAAETAIMKSAGVIADCIALEYNPEKGFLGSRMVYGDSMVAQVALQNSRILVTTINCSTSMNLDNMYEYLYDHDICVIPKNEENFEWKFNDITSSKVVFGVGRGVSEETYCKLEKLAQKIGASIGGSRGAVENGIIPKEMQIGQSGQYISPEVYIAFGISGAGQHLVGIKDAKVIISVNRDSEAQINQYADIVIIDNVENVVDELMNGGT